MNFLALCQEVRRECGISGSGPTTTVSQTGMLLKVVEWTNRAYQDIQKKCHDWKFRNGDGSFDTIAGTDTYLSEMSDVYELDNESVSIYLKATGVSDETEVYFVNYREFRDELDVGTAQSGKPLYFTMQPNYAMQLYPNPDAVYTVNFAYQKKIDVLSGNTDTPLIPDDYQDAIIWKACMYFAKFRENPMVYEMFKENYREALSDLKRDQRIIRLFNSEPLA